MLPPAVRSAIIARIVALSPTTTGSAAYAGSGAYLDDVTEWTECEIPLTPMNLPATLDYLRVWVELGDARDLENRPADTTVLRQEVAVVWLYPCRDTSEAPKIDFDRAWYSMAHLYAQLVCDWDESGTITPDRANGPSLLRPQRVGEFGHLLCEIHFSVEYDLE